MKLLKWVCALGLIITCLSNEERAVYTTFQVDGVVTYTGASLQFQDSTGGYYEVTAQCVVLEGTVEKPGKDMRMTRPPACLKDGQPK